ncbi:MAG TPA: TIGR02452 family protein [Gemmataceae bacterium]|nr:TIGR02452 family protein [Gemmataceae bacterium]
MSTRTKRAQVAQETLTILEDGAYLHPSGRRIAIRDDLASARSRSVLYSPEQFQDVLQRRDQLLRARSPAPVTFEVVNETTLHAARRLVEGELGARVLALNFASARRPGGGFLSGSQAQEESLARASGLYACISAFREMYDVNARFPSCLYTDHMIYSPDVPVFRDDWDMLLERPYPLSFVTAPAVNVGALRRNELGRLPEVGPVMLSRMEKVLSLAVVHGHEVVVLGAWGCGVFGNDPEQVAGWFHRHLAGEGAFRGAFRKVVFAVLDRTGDGAQTRPFERYFGGRLA